MPQLVGIGGDRASLQDPTRSLDPQRQTRCHKLGLLDRSRHPLIEAPGLVPEMAREGVIGDNPHADLVGHEHDAGSRGCD